MSLVLASKIQVKSQEHKEKFDQENFSENIVNSQINLTDYAWETRLYKTEHLD